MKESVKLLKQRHEEETAPALCPVRQKRDNLVGPNGWEILSAVMDSGATVAVLHPGDGKAYKVQEGEAPKNGVEYEIANGDSIPNLGEKSMAVLTPEGILRGYSTQVAGVSSPLQSVRQLLGAGHAVCFGIGEEGLDHLVINRMTGEMNRFRDDGVNYIQDMLVVPPDVAEAVIKHRDRHFGRQG